MKHQFKPFERVLVRDNERSIWKVGIYSHYEERSSLPYVCVGSYYGECISYNEKTAHLVGTNQPYKEPEPKVWRVVNYNNREEIWNFTDDEFNRFIKTAVINNKDVTEFYVRRN